MILSGLKTWLETGEELTTPGSLELRRSRSPMSVTTGVRAISIPVERPGRCACASTWTRSASRWCGTTRRPTAAGGSSSRPDPATPVVTLEQATPDVTRGAIGIRFTTDDADAAHCALDRAGVDTDEILRWPGVPAMFAFRDPDGNAFSITERS